MPATRSYRFKLAIIHLLCPGNKLLELSLDVRITNVLVLQHAIRINRECGGNRVYAKLHGDSAIESTVAILKPGQAVLADKVLPFAFIVIQTDA